MVRDKTITKPKTNWVQNPEIPPETIPASRDPIIIAPIKVPKMVPIPPNTEVPPINTEASDFIR